MRALLEEYAARIIRANLLAGRFASRTYSFRPATGNETIVLMCTWNRPSRFATVLELLDRQDTAGGVRLYLWNNDRRGHRAYVNALRSHDSSGALTTVDIVRSPFNLGAIARFYWARKLALAGFVGPVIVIDDDEDFDSSFVSTALRYYNPRALTAWWAFTVGDRYWDRTPAARGDRVDYAGTGGMICSATIFEDPAFFTDMPRRFWQLDDIWLNHFASRKGYRLEKLPVEITLVMEETNQYLHQVQLKEEFWRYLRSRNGLEPNGREPEHGHD